MNKKIVMISSVVLLFDQIIKSIIELNNVHVTLISNFFAFNYYQNTGAAFSILEGKTYALIAISLVMLVLIYSMAFSHPDSKLKNVAFGLLIGGVLGNLIDRIFYGYVRDFIDIKLFSYHAPVFNIADMAITFGVVLIIIMTFMGSDRSGNKGFRRRKQDSN